MAMAAARIDDTDLWATEGDKHTAAVLAKKAGTSVGRAKDAIRTAKRLGDQPELEAAARKGAVSVDQAAAISDAAAADPQAESRLIDAAGRSTLSELRDECERTRLAADRDAEPATGASMGPASPASATAPTARRR